MTSLPPLEYGPRPSTARRRSRWLILLTTVVAVALIGWRWWPAVNRWQSRARLRYAVLNETITTSGPAVAVAPGDEGIGWLHHIAARPDGLWSRATAELMPPLPVYREGVTNLFVHERTTPGGRHRLVWVNYAPMAAPGRAYIEVNIRLLDPGTLLRPQFRDAAVSRVDGLPIGGVVPGWPGAVATLAKIPWGHAFTLSPGRPDPADGSRFVFDYALDRRAGQIIGTVGDGGTVSFHTADGSPLPIEVPPAPATRAD